MHCTHHLGLLLLLLPLINHLPWTTAQPFDVVSFPVASSLVPIPGDLLAADAPNVTSTSSLALDVASSSAASASSATLASSASVTSSACTSGWSCTPSGQWLPYNISLVLMAIGLSVVMFVVRDDRRTMLALAAWSASFFCILLVNYIIVWYLAVALNLLIYHLIFTWEGKAFDEDESDDEGEEEEDQENTGGGEDEEASRAGSATQASTFKDADERHASTDKESTHNSRTA